MRRFVPLALVLALTFHAAPWAAAAEATGPDYQLNAIVPVTGGGAFLGVAYQQAFRAIENVVNASGGIKGRRLKFVIADSQSSGQVDVQLVNGLIAGHVPAFIDGGPSPACGPSLPLVEKTGPVDYCLSPAIHPAAGSYAFTAAVGTVDLAATAVRYLRERGWQRIAVITSTDSTGVDYERAMTAVMSRPENKNMRLVDSERFNPTDLTVSAQITRMKAANPQAVLGWVTGTPVGTVLRGLKEGGLDVPTMVSYSNMTYTQMSSYASFLPSALYFPTMLGTIPGLLGAGPIRDAQTVYAKSLTAIGVRPEVGQNLAWDPTMLVVDALRRIGPSATAEQVRDFILHAHGWVGINGVYDYASGDQHGIGENAVAIARWDARQGTWIGVSRPRGYLLAH